MLAGLGVAPAAIRIEEEGAPIRDAIAEVLTARGGRISAAPPIFDPKSPRVSYPGRRPVACP